MSDIVERLREESKLGNGSICRSLAEAADEIDRLRAALERVLIGVNHVALYRADSWPEPGTDHMTALEQIGAGQSYDLWCCWNAAMQASHVLDGEKGMKE